MKNTSNNQRTNLKNYINDQCFLKKLTDRVYEIFIEDMRRQQERIKNYGKDRRL